MLKQLDEWLDQEAYAARIQILEKSLREKTKTAQDRIRQSDVALGEAQREADWQRYGDLLKGAIGKFTRRSPCVSAK